jgi:tRNA modification GTPase
MYVADTIVAPATPPGTGAVAIVRLSGPHAIAIARALWHPRVLDLTDLAPRRLYLGEIRDPITHAPIDRAMLAVFPAPHSLTGEDVAELQCHGGVYLVRRVVALATVAGARLAEPGEFSRRAFLNGRIDLTEAEAIADLVAARGESALRMALAQLSGALAARVTNLRRQVIVIRAHLEAEIDFADEDIRLPSRAEIVRAIDSLIADLTVLHDSFARGRIIREGVRAAIIGKPNAGKSSVLNLLLGVDRAIVTPIPGTTRDVIEDSIALGVGLPLVLADTAGLRESTDPVERLGIERTRRHANDTDLVIAVFDSSRPLDSDDAAVIEMCAGRSGVAILNKRDLAPRLNAEMLLVRGLELPLIELSTVTAAGLPELRDRLERTLAELAGVSRPGREYGGIETSDRVRDDNDRTAGGANRDRNNTPVRGSIRDSGSSARDQGDGRDGDDGAPPIGNDVSSKIRDHATSDAVTSAGSETRELPTGRGDAIFSATGARSIGSPTNPALATEGHAAGDATSSGGMVAISRERHRDALKRALDSLAAARLSASSSMPPEIVAVDVMAAADALGSITGVVGTEDVLDALFREFCIGK